MKTIIKIDDKPIEFNTSLAWVYVYKKQFGNDPLSVLLPTIKSATKALTNLIQAEQMAKKIDRIDQSVTAFEMLTEVDIDEVFDALYEIEATDMLNILWALAANAKEIAKPETWLKQFDIFPLDEIASELLPVLIKSVVSTKKLKALTKLTGPEKSPLSKYSAEELAEA